VPLEIGVDLWRKLVLHVIRQKAHEVGAAAFRRLHGRFRVDANHADLILIRVIRASFIRLIRD
jgi:hypothetical protein